MSNAPWNSETVMLKVTKHFALDYMALWRWDFHDLREALRYAYKIKKTGKMKYEIYTNKGGFKKIITDYYPSEAELLCISGSEGGGKQ